MRREKLGFSAAAHRVAMAAAWSMRHWPEHCNARHGKRSGRWKGEVQQTMVGDHKVQHRPRGGLQCTECKLHAATPTSLRSLRQVKCRGNLASQCHVSHLLKCIEGIVYCRNCGAYTTKRPTALRQPCRRAPPTEARRNILRRLQRGLLPTTAKYLWEMVADSVPAAAVGDQQGNSNGNRTVIPISAGGFDDDRCGERQRFVPDGSGVAARAVDGDNRYRDGDGVRDPAPRDHSQRRQRRDDGSLYFDSRRSRMQPTRVGADNGTAQHGYSDDAREGGVCDDGDHGRAGVRVHASASPHECGLQAHHEEKMELWSGPLVGDVPATNSVAASQVSQVFPSGGGGAEPPLSKAKWCSPATGGNTSWSKRVKLLPTARGGQCHLCGVVARTTCRGCCQNICIGCARNQIACRDMATETIW